MFSYIIIIVLSNDKRFFLNKSEIFYNNLIKIYII